jgi:hypothetical protein
MLRSGKRLCWLGIDMRSRWRRRVAVVVTYVASFAAPIMIASGQWWGHPILVPLAVLGLISSIGIFSPWGPVKSFDLRTPAEPSGSPNVIVNGLDQLARYRYGVVDYEAADETQKSDLLQTYHVGMRLYPRRPDLDEQWGINPQDRLDERDLKQRDRASVRTLQFLSILMVSGMVTTASQATSWTAADVFAVMLTYFVISLTGPKAWVLWTEPDPRGFEGEIELVQKET